jgi:protein TonB
MNLFNFSNNNLDEVVFEQRNKAYGAYAIRKAYPSNLNRSTLFTLSPLLIGLIGALLWSFLHPVHSMKLVPGNVPTVPQAKKKVQEIVEMVSGFTFILETPDISFNIVPDKKVKPIVRKPELVKPIERPAIPSFGAMPSLPQMGGLGMGLPGLVGAKGGQGTGGEEGGNQIIDFTAEVMPMFPGGQEAMYDFISKNLVYPRQALEGGVSGKVVISFVILEDGKVGMINLERGIGYGCDEEALRVINEMPEWEPARQNGRKVPIRMILPVVFQTN